jgi:TRAP-type C4-dicarboxylate transport system permease large subunit
VSLEDVFRGSFGFAIMMLIGLILIAAFPEIVLWLPGK